MLSEFISPEPASVGISEGPKDGKGSCTRFRGGLRGGLSFRGGDSFIIVAVAVGTLLMVR